MTFRVGQRVVCIRADDHPFRDDPSYVPGDGGVMEVAADYVPGLDAGSYVVKRDDGGWASYWTADQCAKYWTDEAARND